MRWHVGIALAGLIVALSLGAGSAQAGKGVKKSQKEHTVHGVVVLVEHLKNHQGVIEIKTHHHKKKTARKPGQTHLHRFTVGSDTQFFTMHKLLETPASFASVHKGDHVAILAKNHHAERVLIHHHHHKKK
jgi:hypothetical protein